ncbi:MAG TPA: class I SAM-dependent methyltransferase, partial [Myxococcota bacterium]|nr:class I SAM-dependent methyltransferase [Myxococcota bacterium]
MAEPGSADERVQQYADYVRSPLGWLRDELLRHHLAAHGGPPPLRVLDAGCGLGALGLALARAGHEVVLVDAAPAMIARVRQAAQAEAEAVQQRIGVVVADLHDLPATVTAQPYQVILCHNVLEFSPQPARLLTQLGNLLVPGGGVSLLVANRASDPLKTALTTQNLRQARKLLDAHFQASMFGPKRNFTPGEVAALCLDAGLTPHTTRPIRVVADLLPLPLLNDVAQRESLLALEISLSEQPEYQQIG